MKVEIVYHLNLNSAVQGVTLEFIGEIENINFLEL